MQNLVYFSYAVQIVAIIVLFINCIYVLMQRPSKIQIQIFTLLITTLITLVGYLVEITATNVEEAMIGVYVSYLGKPFAMLATTLFIASYCGRPISQKYVVPLILFHGIFPAIVFTNEFHYLYYSWVEFNRAEYFSPLYLGHGPFYFLYMATIFANSTAIVYYTVCEWKMCRNKDERKRIFYLFAMIASSVIGYIIFLTVDTAGFDTTMIGAVLESFIITLLFYKYNIFDLLTLAKDMSFRDSSTGLLVINARDNVEYSNSMMERLLDESFSLDELRGCPSDKVSTITKNGLVYEIKKTQFDGNGYVLGECIEVNDITDKYNYSAKLEKEVESRMKELVHIQRTVSASFAGVVEARDNSTGAHIKSMSRYVELIARKLQQNSPYKDMVTDSFIDSLVDVAPLHDIGKLSIPDSILLKPGKLSEEEFNLMKTHTKQGAKIIEQCLTDVESEGYVSLAKDVALYHHEKWNGTGYPEGLSGEDIPLSARIVALADVFDAISTERCYKEAYPLDKCFAIITRDRGTHFDPYIVDAFMSEKDEVIKLKAEENREQPAEELQLR